MEGEEEQQDQGSVDSPTPLEDRHPRIPWILDRFHLNLDALREMLRDFLPEVASREDRRRGIAAVSNMNSLDETQKDRLRSGIDEILEKARSGNPSNLRPEVIVDLGPLLTEVFEDDRHSLVSFVERIRKLNDGPDLTAIMHNSLLAQAVAAFEVLISGVITQYFLSNRSALETGEKEFSLADLREFKDVDDAADVLVARHVSRVMYGDLEAWAEWFDARCKADLTDLALDWDRLQEVFQRRHVIMHNGGLVSRQYLSKTPGADADLKVGQRLTVDADYLDTAFDELEVLGTLIAVLSWGSWEKSDRDQSAGRLLHRSYELMLVERWRAGECILEKGLTMHCSAAVKEPMKVNHWNCRLEQYGYDHIKDDVSDWDVSVAVGRFKLAKLVLLGELEKASKLADQLIERKEISPGQMNEWPILRTLRDHREDGSSTIPSSAG